MFEFGIVGYRPVWLDNRVDVAREHGSRLRGPAGRTVDPTRPVRWPGFDLQWRSDALPELRAQRGLPLKGVELLEWTGRDVAHGNVDVSFAFETGRVTVFNALDENGVGFGPPGPSQRIHPLP
ncbi:hypothetical protein [Streptomyces sp. NPDC007369]|uniref:hypothetical protein n=1 Tax=Streptomyces sp. NPDC007369 TaxID=3154589 RepID=UPI00340EE1C8